MFLNLIKSQTRFYKINLPKQLFSYEKLTGIAYIHVDEGCEFSCHTETQPSTMEPKGFYTQEKILWATKMKVKYQPVGSDN